jgi:hypothetical protein
MQQSVLDHWGRGPSLLEGQVDSTGQSKCRVGFLSLGIVAALVCNRSSPASAQDVQLRPEARLSSPTRISIRDGTLNIQQKIGVRVGARLTVTFNQRLELLTNISYTPGYAMVHAAGKRIEFRTSSQLLSGSTGARYWLLPASRPLSWEVHTGLGMVFGGQPAYKDLFEVSTMSGVLGTTVRYEIGRIVSLYLRVQERLFRVSFGSRASATSSRPLQISFGLGFPFLERLVEPRGEGWEVRSER